MATQGELVYREVVVRLSCRIANRIIDGQNTQKIGKFFWPFMNELFKTEKRNEDGRQAFWRFAIMLKRCFMEENLDIVYDLWQDFDQNAKNLFENFINNCVNEFVNDVL